MNVTELIDFLNAQDARPKKHLSQNFLIDQNVIQKILSLAEVKENETILEIGPGPGALTKALLDKGAKVYAVEMDSIFAKQLNRFQNGRLTVFEKDFLKFPMELLPPKFKVVANLPYHITTPILEKLFASSFSSITVMVQKEVATRMQAESRIKDFGSLSLFIQYHSNIHGSFNVAAGSFFPKPKVDSTVIRLDEKEVPEVNPFYLIHPAFQQRRKMLTSTLPFPKEQIREALAAINVRIDARPEMLSLEKWIELSKTINPL